MTDKTAIKYIVLRALVFSGAFCFCFLAFFGNFALGSVSSGKSDSGNSALSALDGIKLEPEETFSFNGIVGERSERRGYKVSKVINNGEYAEGVGGGVCQVSTTVYNAALISGLEIVERHRHTLLSGYVEAGFDAMVSYGGADLKIKNNTGGNVYILTDMSGDGKIRVIFFGVKNPYEIKRESVLVADYGNGSVKTDSYLSYFREGRLLRRVRIHGDYYYPKRKP